MIRFHFIQICLNFLSENMSRRCTRTRLRPVSDPLLWSCFSATRWTHKASRSQLPRRSWCFQSWDWQAPKIFHCSQLHDNIYRLTMAYMVLVCFGHIITFFCFGIHALQSPKYPKKIQKYFRYLWTIQVAGIQTCPSSWHHPAFCQRPWEPGG